MIPHFARSTTHRYATTAQSLTMAFLPHGGQRLARRNAWASMSQDAVTARARRDADAAMDRAVSTAQRFAAH